MESLASMMLRDYDRVCRLFSIVHLPATFEWCAHDVRIIPSDGLTSPPLVTMALQRGRLDGQVPSNTFPA